MCTQRAPLEVDGKNETDPKWARRHGDAARAFPCRQPRIGQTRGIEPSRGALETLQRCGIAGPAGSNRRRGREELASRKNLNATDAPWGLRENGRVFS